LPVERVHRCRAVRVLRGLRASGELRPPPAVTGALSASRTRDHEPCRLVFEEGTQEAAGSSCGLLLQQSVNEDLRVKRRKIIGTFAAAEELDWTAQLPLYLDHNAALRRPVKFGEHDACHVNHLGKDPSLDEPVLAG